MNLGKSPVTLVSISGWEQRRNNDEMVPIKLLPISIHDYFFVVTGDCQKSELRTTFHNKPYTNSILILCNPYMINVWKDESAGQA